jgi:hypothetical protein
MRATRKELVEGLILLGSIGWLVAAFVVPGQWQNGRISTEGIVGMTASTTCLVLAIVLARAPRARLLVLPLAVIGAISSVYALVILDVTSGVAVAFSPSALRLVVAALLAIAIAAFVAAVKLKRRHATSAPPDASQEQTRGR